MRKILSIISLSLSTSAFAGQIVCTSPDGRTVLEAFSGNYGVNTAKLTVNGKLVADSNIEADANGVVKGDLTDKWHNERFLGIVLRKPEAGPIIARFESLKADPGEPGVKDDHEETYEGTFVGTLEVGSGNDAELRKIPNTFCSAAGDG